MGVNDAVGKVLVPAVDKVVELRYDAARASAASLVARNPNAKPGELADVLVRRYRKELGAVGAAAGGASAVPGVGTAGGAAVSSVDVAWTISRLAEMILAIGAVYGHDVESIEERRAWVMAVLSMALGASTGISGLAAEVGQKGGVRIVRSIPMPVIHRINHQLGGRIIVKWTTKQGVVRLGRLVPFGVGAGIGMAGNVMLVRSVGARAKDFFDEPPSGVAMDRPKPGGGPVVIGAQV